MEVSLFGRIQLYPCQCEGFQMGQSNGVLLIKEVSTFRRCPLIEVLLHTHVKARDYERGRVVVVSGF